MHLKNRSCFYLFTVSFFLFHLNYSFGQQNETDSLEKQVQHRQQDDTTKVILLNKIAYNYYGANIDDLNVFARKAIALSVKLHYLKGEAIAYKDLGLGSMLINGDPIALEYFERSDKLFVQLKDDINQARVLNNIGYYYSDLKDFQQSLKYFNQACDRVKNSRNYHLQSILFGNIGNNYLDLGDYKNSAKYYNEELMLAKKVPEKDVLIIGYLNLADLAIRQHDYPEARNLVENILTYKNSPDFRERDEIDLLRLQGELNYAAKDYTATREILSNGLSMAKKLGSIDQKMAFYHNLYILDSTTSNYAAAMRNGNKFHQLNDSINNSKRNQLIALYQIKFDLEKRREENERLNNAAEKYRNTIKQQHKEELIILGILLLIILLLIYFKRINNQINKKNEIIKEQNVALENTNEVKDKLFSVISHDIRSPIVQMVTLLTLWEDDDGDHEEIKGLTSTVKGSVINTLEMLDNLLTWSKNQLQGFQYNPVLFNLQVLIQENILGFDMIVKTKELSVTNNIPENIEIMADRDMMKIVFRNLIANATKFTPKKGSIIINHTIKSGFIIISVEDTGVGIKKKDLKNIFAFNSFTTPGTDAEKGTGLGLKMCRDFVKMNKGTITMESTENEGSKFFIQLPY